MLVFRTANKTFHVAEMLLCRVLFLVFYSACRSILGFLTCAISYQSEADGFIRQCYVCGGDFTSSNTIVGSGVLGSSWLVTINTCVLPLGQINHWVDTGFNFSAEDMLIHLSVKTANPDSTFIVWISLLENVKI